MAISLNNKGNKVEYSTSLFQSIKTELQLEEEIYKEEIKKKTNKVSILRREKKINALELKLENVRLKDPSAESAYHAYNDPQLKNVKHNYAVSAHNFLAYNECKNLIQRLREHVKKDREQSEKIGLPSQHKNEIPHHTRNSSSPISVKFEDMDLVAESSLKDIIKGNWNATPFCQNWKLEGEEIATGVGRIDLLAKSKRGSDCLVVEIKKGKVSSRVIGQVQKYMGWLETEKKYKSVKGVIVAREMDDTLLAALKVAQNISFVQYSLKQIDSGKITVSFENPQGTTA